jgi:hypothetical protein
MNELYIFLVATEAQGMSRDNLFLLTILTSVVTE